MRDVGDVDSEQIRHPEQTVSVLTYRTGVQDANVAGNVHGGQIMKLCDDAAVIAATRLAGGRVVTAAVDEMKFRTPVHVGDVLTLRATVNAARGGPRWRSASGSSPRTWCPGPSSTPARPT